MALLPRSADAGEELHLQLDWQAPATCPDEAAVEERIRALLPAGTQKQLQLEATGRITKNAEQYQLHLILRDGKFRSEQDFAGESCDDVVGAAAVSIALLVQSRAQSGAHEQERESSGSSGSSPEGVENAPEDDIRRGDQQTSSTTGGEASSASATQDSRRSRRGRRETHQARRPRTARDWRMVLALPAVNANIGLLPKASAGWGAGIGLEVRRFQALLTGWWTMDPGSNPPDDFPATSAQLQHARVAAQACRWSGPDGFNLGPCLDLTVEHLAARAEGTDVAPQPRTATWMALGPAASARVFATRWLAVSAHLGLHFQSSRPVLSVEGQGELGQVGLLNLTGNLMAEWIF